ncbi:MAG: helix-turn-helix transcriptional regulator [Pseudomonas sp.]
MDTDLSCNAVTPLPKAVTLLTSNALLGQLFRHFLGNGAELQLALLSPDEADSPETALWLLDVGSVDALQLSPLLERLLALAPVALVNVSQAQAEQLVEKHPWINGFFYSHATREQLLAGIAVLLKGGVWMPRDLMELLLRQLRRLREPTETMAELTLREQEILCLVGKGLSNAEVAEQLCLSPHTVKSHIHNVLGKLGASNRAEAVFLLRARLGWD